MIPPQVLQQLRNIPVRELIAGMEREGFTYRRLRGSGRVYRHSDGRRMVIHYYHSGDTLPIGTLRHVVRGTCWTEVDLQRLGLIPQSYTVTHGI